MRAKICVQRPWKFCTGNRLLPPVEIHLHKQIPVGAGLGGGSSNATPLLEGSEFNLTDSPAALKALHEMAARAGKRLSFFLHDNAMMMEGRGEILMPRPLSLEGLCLVLLFPEIHISTAEAYSGVSPRHAGHSPRGGAEDSHQSMERPD